MSNSLVRKSLELLSYETDVNKGLRDQRRKKKTKTSSTLDLIPINHRIISKDKKKGSKSVLKRSSNVTVYEVKKQLESKVDQTEENVKQLLILSGNRLDPETSEKLLCRAVKKRYIKKEEEPKEEEGTVFTEEDFQKFETEYIG